MNGVLERTLGILELLAQHGEGMEMAAIADQLDIPRSAVHRLLADLTRCGYVRQTRDHGDYLLTTKLVSMGLSFLSKSGIVDIAQPLLDRLAEISGELVRLSVVDGNRLTWVARAQGARQGLRYDPDMGSDAQLSCSSSGHAWLSALSDDDALALVAQQGLGNPQEFGPNAPASLQAVMDAVRETRERGFSLTEETYTARPECHGRAGATGRPAADGHHQHRRTDGALHAGAHAGAGAGSAVAGRATGRCQQRIAFFHQVCRAPGQYRESEFRAVCQCPAHLADLKRTYAAEDVEPHACRLSCAHAAQTCDLLVIGSGAGGLSAAVVAAHLGLKVIVIEKDPQYGGTTAWSGGWMWIPRNPLAVEAGLAETIEQPLSYLRHELGAQFDEARARAFLDNGPRMVEFFRSKTALQFIDGNGVPDFHGRTPDAATGGRSICAAPFDGRRLGRQHQDPQAAAARNHAVGHGHRVGRGTQAFPERHAQARLVLARHETGAALLARPAAPPARHAAGQRQCAGGRAGGFGL